MASTQQVMLALGGAPLDGETMIWRDRAIAAGGTFGTNSISVADALIRAIKVGTFNSKIKYLLPLLGGNLATARVPLRDTLSAGIATNNNFVDADFSQSTGLQGNGSTKRLDTLLKASQLGSSNNGGIGYWERAVGGTWCVGSRDAGTAQIFGLAIYSDELFYWGDADSATRTFVAAGNNHYYGQRSSDTARVLYRNGTSVATDATSPIPNVSAIAANNLNVMAIDSGNFSNGRCGVAYFTDGTMTGTEISDFHTLLNTYLITPTGR